MTHYYSIGHRLPHFLAAPLFGDRAKFGLDIQRNDPDWAAWQGFYLDFYQNTQKQGIGKLVNDAGYKILRSINLNGKRVLEIGPGTLPHLHFWQGTPRHYSVVDNQQFLLDRSAEILKSIGIPFSCYLTDSHFLPIKDEQYDLVISFYAFEHLHPFESYLRELKRVLRANGALVGGIPSEGGLAWGLGRLVTSRRYMKRNASFNPDKIICWEHPNFAEDVLRKLDGEFVPVRKGFWPLLLPLIDLNLIVNFIYRHRGQ